MRGRAWLSVFAVVVAGCGGSTSVGNGGAGQAGTSAGGSGAATGGSGAATGGSGAATGGSGAATGGSGAATGGSGGSGAATGGTSSGGTGGSGAPPECRSAADCKLWEDCCTCVALAPGEPAPASCPASCSELRCATAGITQQSVACVAGRCVAGFDCASEVWCNALPPDCDPGWVPSVVSGCWGDCVPATECLSVPSCNDCASDTTCALYENMTGPEAHCVGIPDQCKAQPVCACLDSSVCQDPNWLCSDLSGIRGVACSCPDC